MKRKILVFLIIITMLLMLGVLVACNDNTTGGQDQNGVITNPDGGNQDGDDPSLDPDGGNQDGDEPSLEPENGEYDEIVSFTEFENYYVAKVDDGYNIFTPEGNKVLPQDYHHVTVGNFLVVAKNMGEDAQYFKIDGTKLNFSVDGLAINKVSTSAYTKNVMRTNFYKTYSRKLACFEVQYYESATSIYYYSIFDIDGTLLITTTDQKGKFSNDDKLTTQINCEMFSSSRYENEDSISEYKLEYIYKQNTYNVTTDSTKNSRFNYTSEISIYNHNFEEVFSQEIKGSKVSYTNKDKDTIIIDYSDMVDNVQQYYSLVINTKNGNSKLFDLGQFVEGYGTSKALNTYYNGIFVLKSKNTYANETFTIYDSTLNIAKEVCGSSYDVIKKHIVITRLIKNGTPMYDIFRINTMEIVKSDISKIERKIKYTFVDNVLCNAYFEPLVSEEKAKNITKYDIYAQTEMDIYFYAYNNDSTVDYYKNNVLLKSFSSNETILSKGLGYIAVKDVTTGKIVYYDMLTPDVKYNKPETHNIAGLNGDIFRIITDTNAQGDVDSIHAKFGKLSQSFNLETGAKYLSFTARCYLEEFLVLNIINYNAMSEVVREETHIYLLESMNAPEVALHEVINTSHIYTYSSPTSHGFDIKELSKGLIGVYIYNGSDSQTIIYEKYLANNGQKYVLKFIASIDYENLEFRGNYFIKSSPMAGSKYNEVYNISGKKVVDSDFIVKEIRDNFAVYTRNNSTFGIIQFTDDGYKIIEEAKYGSITLLNEGYYIYKILDNNMAPMYTMKNAKGEVIIDSAYYIKTSNNLSIIEDGKQELNIMYQTSPNGKFSYLSLGKIINYRDRQYYM